MKIITVNISEMHMKSMSKLVEIGVYQSRSELIRMALKDFLLKNAQHLENYENYSNLHLKFSGLYDSCILCGIKLHKIQKPFKIKQFEILDLRFCCRCFKQLKGKSFDNFPKRIKEKIIKRIKKYTN